MASTRDHVVPQTYLRRFGKRGSNGHLVEVMDADNPEVRFSARTKRIAAEQDFHLALLEDGSWDHSMEDTLGLVETGATQAMSTLLDRDDPSDDAYPPWPCHPALRMSLALFVAAQVVRTVPQRERLGRLLGSATNSGLPDWVLPNMHLRYMTEAVVPLALLLSDRAWAFGVSGECLMTSDNPAILLRGRPDEDPAMAAGLWDIYLPLDPHRFLFIPGTDHVDRPWLIRKDHRLLLDGGMAQGLNSCVFDQANRHVFWHPDHDPVEQQGMKDYRKMRASWKDGHSDFILVYDALPDRFGVRLKDLTGHVRGPAN